MTLLPHRMGMLDVFAFDLAAMIDDLPINVIFREQAFGASRTTLRRANTLSEGGFLEDAAMTITAHYDAITQKVSLGDTLMIDGRKFRVISADLAADAVSVDFTLQDINR